MAKEDAEKQRNLVNKDSNFKEKSICGEDSHHSVVKNSEKQAIRNGDELKLLKQIGIENTHEKMHIWVVKNTRIEECKTC